MRSVCQCHLGFWSDGGSFFSCFLFHYRENPMDIVQDPDVSAHWWHLPLLIFPESTWPLLTLKWLETFSITVRLEERREMSWPVPRLSLASKLRYSVRGSLLYHGECCKYEFPLPDSPDIARRVLSHESTQISMNWTLLSLGFHSVVSSRTPGTLECFQWQWLWWK